MIIAFVIIIPPLWKQKTVQDEDFEQRNVRISKEKAKELKRQLQTGALSQQQFDEQYEELTLSLGDDLNSHLDDEQATHADSGVHGRWIIPVLVVIIPLFSILTYFNLGEPDALKKAQMVQALPAQDDINTMTMVQGLADRLAQQPNNAKGWMMLGRSYKYLKKYDLAANALANAYTLVDDDPELMLDYADTLAMINKGRIVGQAAQLVFKSLQLLPNNISALWLAGMAKSQVGEFAAAMQYWKKLETLLPPGSDAQELQKMMESVQAQLLASEPIKPYVSAGISIDVKVSMNAKIVAKTAQHDTVFIYAKALTGPPMPLAIVRKKVSDLPLSVTLDDSMAMMPAMKLSNFKAVKVIARISKSGTARQQKGDYIGILELHKLTGNTSAVIVINKEIITTE